MSTIMSKQIKPREECFTAADGATATLELKRVPYSVPAVYVIVAHLPAGIQQFPEVICRSDDPAKLREMWKRGKSWVKNVMGIA